MSGYVRATNVVVNPNHLQYGNKSPFGFSVKIDNFDNPCPDKTKTTLLLNSETNSTDGWKKLEFHFISFPSGSTTLNCHLGNYYGDAKGKVEFAGVTLKEDASYRKVSHSDFAAAVPVSQLVNHSVSDLALDNWGLKLNAATQKLKELTGMNLGVSQCFMHNNQQLDIDYNEPYACAYTGGYPPCQFSTAASDFTMQYAPNQDAVEHGQLHEISHTYNTDLNRVWNFNDEIFTNVRATYAAVENNLKVVCADSLESYNSPYQGMRYKQLYDSRLAEYLSNPNQYTRGYELYAMAGIYLRMVYGDSSAGLPPLGWNVFKEFFTNGIRYTPRNTMPLIPSLTYENDFKVFNDGLDIIAQISGKRVSEIINYIPNGFYWNWYNYPSQYPFKTIKD
ncbi:hypothetical protein [Ruminiclostridium cellulolyticum]|uniref:Peptidase M60 domain-containing protein n=1 Tax=Ruminiclostridium cellulolyticum (strain ATCC 35319 / DSM 5812 / JCM 6584 / H10) TaxID=394503 RepID=B8I5G0_RUMCH|nr:hypothetical protein [Ruminiclostridium cellulolyticum]ACL76696.1 hypothetical protein Ccel_2362 [Ruminiclostridium cellulolyticum H10]